MLAAFNLMVERFDRFMEFQSNMSHFLYSLQRKYPSSLSKSHVLYIPIWISHECQCPETSPTEVTFTPILSGKWLIF